jgi:hypothetical protein
MRRVIPFLVVLALIAGCVAIPTAAPVEPVKNSTQPNTRGLTTGTGIVDTGGEGIASYAGGGLYAYSDAGSTETFSVASDTGIVTATGLANLSGGVLSTGVIANTGVFTTSVKVAGTPVARLSGSAIDASSLKVALTPVALLQGSAIDASSLKVALTPVAKLSGSAIDATSLGVNLTPVALLSGSTINATALTVVGTPVVVQTGAFASNARMVCGSTTITGTGTLPHALATPQFVQLSLGQNVTGDCTALSYTNASAVVTAKCFNSALTPVAAATPAPIDWCVIGKP